MKGVINLTVRGYGEIECYSPRTHGSSSRTLNSDAPIPFRPCWKGRRTIGWYFLHFLLSA